MQKTNFLKKSIHLTVCAIMLAFGALIAGTGTVQAASLLDYTVTYSLGEGPSEATVTLGKDAEKKEEALPAEETWSIDAEKYVLPEAPQCKDSNFSFIEWKDVATGKTYKAGAEYTIDNKMSGGNEFEFEAVWGIPITYDVNLADTTAGVTAPAAAVAPFKKDFTLPVLSATNYEFIGWAKAADAVTADYKVGDPMPAADITAAVKLYGVWKANFFQVIYHANTGSETEDANVMVPSDTTKYMGDNLTATIMGDGKLASTNKNYATMKDATPARTGYTFVGWATSPTATAAEYKVGATVEKMDKDLNLYAVWTKGTAAAGTGAASGSSGTNNTTSTSPQTGDNDHLSLYIVMAALSLLGIGYLFLDQKKAKARK